MKRKLFAGFLALILLLAIPTASFAAPNLGITNIRFTYEYNGDVTVRWDDSGSGPYKIQYRLDEWKSNYSYYENSNGKYVTLSYLIPGQQYTVTVSNGSKSAIATYTVPYSTFRDFKTGGYLTMTEGTFSISNLERWPNETFDLRVSYPRLSHDRTYSAKLALKTPLGYSGCVQYWATYKFERKYKYEYTTFSMLDDFLKNVEDDFDYIPTGKYQFQFFVDGQLYDVVYFTVSR